MATTPVSRAVMLFGTDEKVPPIRVLRAARLSAELEAGNLRYIRFDGIEMIRAIAYIVRDRNWATYNPVIEDLQVTETVDSFRVSYRATARDAEQSFGYRAEIEGRSDGSLRFSAVGLPETDFVTNRTGFVVLHPIEGVAGGPVSIEHVDGSVRESRFPELVDPVQPMLELRALTHSFAPGARVTCRMEGDTFEMEDQRNWTDASYKTYVRPLALPWPYTLAAGTEIVQSVSVSVSGAPGASARADPAIGVSIGAAAGAMPPVGIGLDPSEHAAAFAALETLRVLRPAHVVCRHDRRLGHNRETLARAVEFAAAIGAPAWLEAVIEKVEGWQREVVELGVLVRDLGAPFAVVLVSPAADLKCTLPGSVWPPAPPAAELYRAARTAFPGARIGGGMFSYFTELNRKRPPLDDLDLVSFTTTPLVHAGDDRTVLENLESLPAIARSVRAFSGGKPFHVGPSAIGMRDNPYGAAPMPNPGNTRQAMSRDDPRQKGLLAAAWTLGHVARFAAGGASALTLGGAAGPFGVLEHDRLFPVFHVLHGVMALHGAQRRDCAISRPHDLQAIAMERDGTREVWLTNLTLDAATVRFEPPLRSARVLLLDETRFDAAAASADFIDRAEIRSPGGDLLLRPLAVARVRLAAN